MKITLPSTLEKNASWSSVIIALCVFGKKKLKSKSKALKGKEKKMINEQKGQNVAESEASLHEPFFWEVHPTKTYFINLVICRSH